MLKTNTYGPGTDYERTETKTYAQLFGASRLLVLLTVAYLADQGHLQVRVAQVAHLTGLSDSSARQALTRLVSSQWLRLTGSNPQQYSLTTIMTIEGTTP